MGNDSSRLKGLIIDKNAVEANDFWALYNAEMPTTHEEGKQLLSIFQGEPVVTGQLWVTQGPMERAIKNFMIYRHPYILKYVATWEQGGQKHLATERVRPLIAEVGSLSDIQVCLGLRTILCSLIFLVEKAQARHLNICISSINIALDGSWRLAGFEYVWKAKEVTKTLLDLANAYRYKPAIDAHEIQENNSDCIEQYAFATLCEEILAKLGTSGDTATPYVQDFCAYCATHLKHKNAQMRPKLSAVLLHPYFNHEFVLIHSFLIELPLKSVPQKQEFFTGLIDRLRCFNEEVVGAQLAELLLSRMVLLDPTAQLCVTPYVLKTKSDHSSALFSNSTYSKYLMPHIKKNFRLRDAQIRLILLEYFVEFVRLLSKDELENFVLPHLQAGMRDTNDILVAKTMRCLADLVPILGSNLVVGGERMRLFSDGRPQAALPDATSHWVEPRSITPVMGVSNSMDYMVSGSPLPPENIELGSSYNSLLAQTDILVKDHQVEMPPRLSPDGGEDDLTSVSLGIDGLIVQRTDQDDIQQIALADIDNVETEKTKSPEEQGLKKTATAAVALSVEEGNDNFEDEEAWSDWENDELQRLNINNQNSSPLDGSPSNGPTQNILSSLPFHEALKTTETASTSTTSLKTNTSNKINDDLSSLDIIVQKTVTAGTDTGDAYDFFKDMEPVIEKRRNIIHNFEETETTSVTMEKPNATPIEEEIKIDSSRFAAVDLSEVSTSFPDANGWGVDDDDVGWDTHV